ncbi:PDC sensor domain-containing protein [Shewanella algae]|uniref:PDC sensor domain-containing protein n=1 Tax=Shewanella algae TaxID=38313 RepID=UPI001C929A33|nr:PDC sensor domain-containing protein [Shewanella algae]
MDKQWRAQVAAADKPLVDKLLNNPLSDFLRQKLQQSNGLYTEIFVMDDKGLNVGQSAMTSDYWQGDEAKWQQIFAKGPDSIHISEVEEDESTQSYQSQLSLPVVDPSSGAVIGAITLGINVELL